ncbi:MAG: helix-turn-helix domain-containing protein, partial [Gemmatimonadota bacterium]
TLIRTFCRGVIRPEMTTAPGIARIQPMEAVTGLYPLGAENLEVVWDANPEIQTRTVDMHVQRLRQKLGGAAHLIETVRGFGYRLRDPAEGARR